jgi:hypothetical protein
VVVTGTATTVVIAEMTKPPEAQAPTDYVTAFKQFLAAPPDIKSLRATRHSASPRLLYRPDGTYTNLGTEYFDTFIEVRYQSNGMFAKATTNYDTLLNKNAGGSPFDAVGGWWHDGSTNIGWSIVGGQYAYDPTADLRHQTLTFVRLNEGTRLMTLGNSFGPIIGAVCWDGNRIQGTNAAGKPFAAELKVDRDGFPSAMDCSWPQGMFIDGSNAFNLRYTYHFDTNIPGWHLPTRIRYETPANAARPYGSTNEEEITSVEYSTKPLDQWSFRPEPFCIAILSSWTREKPPLLLGAVTSMSRWRGLIRELTE